MIIMKNFIADLYPDLFPDINTLRNLILPETDDPVSIIVPTHNRCPYNPMTDKELNPLQWFLDSIRWQQKTGEYEIVVVDDASNDFTEEVVGLNQDLPIVYHRNNCRRNFSTSRNIGLSVSSYNTLLFLDDDVVCSPSLVGIMMYAWKRSYNGKLGVIVVPNYKRSTLPEQVEMKDIGVLDLDTGRRTSAGYAFPLVYLNGSRASRFENGVLVPVPVTNFGGTFITDKNVIDDIGGFPTFPVSDHATEAEAALRLKERGYQSHLVFDPRASCTHLMYGRSSGRQKLNGRDWKIHYGLPGISLSQMVKESVIPRVSGCKEEDDRIFLYAAIANYARVFKGRSQAALESWERKTYQTFVVDNDTGFYEGRASVIDDRKQRERIWYLAFTHALSNSVYTTQEISQQMNI